MLSRVLETIRLHRLMGPGQSVLVGLSGGPDSWALLLALQRLSGRLDISIAAACVDHGLRSESAAEAVSVQKACEARGISCVCLRVDVQAQRAPHVSLQDAARRARLDALAAFAAERGCTAVALGHTADDQAETILFRIVRGTGLKGLAGIPYKRGIFVRPLRDVRRREVERFVARAKVTPVRDPSNANASFTRVRVRHEWLPYLARENPKVVEALLALGDDAHRLATEPANRSPVLAHAQASEEGVATSAWGSAGMSSVGPGAPSNISRRAARAVARLAAAGGSGAVSVPGGRIDVVYGESNFVAGPGPAPAQPHTALAVQIKSCTRVRRISLQPGAPVLLLRTLAMKNLARYEGFVAFDADQVVWPLTVRTWRAGDWMRPRGGRGRRKLQDLFVDAKVPRARRSHLPVLVDNEGVILFVPGLRPSAHAVTNSQTRRCLIVAPQESAEITPKSLATRPR